MSPVNPDDFDKVIAAISSKYDGDIRNGNSYEHPPRISTRSLALDFAMGGGVPRGRIIRLYGAYCLDPNTLVLKSDYSWVPVCTLVEGDQLVGFDEYTVKPGSGQQRTLQKATVLENRIRTLPSRRIVTNKGSDTVCSNKHMWLVRASNGSVFWKRADDLVVGDKILWFGEPWSSPVDPLKAAYLGGLFDGEGWVSKANGSRICFAQVEGEVLRRGMEYLRILGFSDLLKNKQSNNERPCYSVSAAGSVKEMMRFLHQIPACRIRANAGEFWVGRALTSKGRFVDVDNGCAEVVAIENVGLRPVCAIETSTKTLIADGLMSHNSSSKTLNGFNIIAEAQSLGLVCAYWNIEKSYDPEFVADNCGVDTENLLIVEGTTIEEIGEKLEALMTAVHVHVIDSCSAAVSIDEIHAKVEEWRPGISARAWGKIFRRINQRFDAVDNTIILLDQVRTNFKTSSEDPPGGRILDHASSMSVKFRKGGWLQRNPAGNLVLPKKGGKTVSSDMGDMEQPPGIEIKCRVEKSRVCRPLVPAEMRLDLEAVRFDRTYELMEAAKAFQVVENRGGGNYYYPFAPKGGKKQQRLYGEDALRAYIDMHPTVQREIRDVAMKIARTR